MRYRSKAANEFGDAMDKLVIMQLMQKHNLQDLAQAYSKYEGEAVSVEQMKDLIRKHFKSAGDVADRFVARHAADEDEQAEDL